MFDNTYVYIFYWFCSVPNNVSKDLSFLPFIYLYLLFIWADDIDPSPILKVEEPGTLRAGKIQCFSFTVGQQGREPCLPPPFFFFSIQALKGLDNTHPLRGPSALLSLPIQRLISSRNTSQTHPEIMFRTSCDILWSSQVYT